MKIKFAVFLFLFSLFIPIAYAGKPVGSQPVPYSICIDAGHGGTDMGTVNEGLQEKNVNLDTAKMLRDKLVSSSLGFTVFMTRTTDVALSNADRYNYCNSQKAAILVSIHHNGSSNSSIDYATALYMKKVDKTLADLVATKVSTALGLPKNPISRFASGVLLKANMPATISEGFFLTNTNEHTLLTTDYNSRLNQEADGLLNAVNSYFGR